MGRMSEEVIEGSEELFADSQVAPNSEDVLVAPDSENGSAVATNDDGESLLFVDLATAISKQHDGDGDRGARCAKKPRPTAVTEQAPAMACAKELPLNYVAVADTVDPDSFAVADTVDPDSVAVADTVDPDSVEEVPDSVEEAPDNDKVVRCPRCGTFHAGGVFGEECKQARREASRRAREASRCARCGLVHSDYDWAAVHIYDMEKFDCEFFIPDVDKLVMRGDSIYLTDEVMKKLEEHYKAVEKSKEEAKMKKLEEEATVHDGKHDH